MGDNIIMGLQGVGWCGIVIQVKIYAISINSVHREARCWERSE